MPVHRLNLTGKRFSRLVVTDFAYTKNYNTYWNCVCDCGNKTIVQGTKLTQGRTKSCGCYMIDRIKETNSSHGQRHTRLYGIYCKMKERCNNPNSIEYSSYGGRGIRLCPEWENDFNSFYQWAKANGYTDSLSIDRIDNDKGYEPENCRWADRITQANNKRTNHYLTYNGKTQSIAQWARETGLSQSCLRHRIYRGWDVEKALSTPMKGEKNG